MTRYGLCERQTSALLCDLVSYRLDLPSRFRFFSPDKHRLMQSINRSYEEYYEMATKAKKAMSSTPKSDGEFQWKGFIDVKLGDVEKANLSLWDVNDGDVWDGIAQYCEAGVKVALTYNKANASFNCAGTGQPASGANNGYCVVAHARDPYTAARVWLFKVATLLPAVWSEYDSGDTDDIG